VALNTIKPNQTICILHSLLVIDMLWYHIEWQKIEYFLKWQWLFNVDFVFPLLPKRLDWVTQQVSNKKQELPIPSRAAGLTHDVVMRSVLLIILMFCYCFVCHHSVCPMFPVSLDCTFLIVPSIFSDVCF
jgi:hypothetical protein